MPNSCASAAAAAKCRSATLSRLARQRFKAYVGGFAQMQAFLVQQTYEGMGSAIDALRQDVKAADHAVEYHCAEPKPDLEQPPIDKEIDAVIAALQESSEVEASPTFECAIKAGDLMTIEVKLPDAGILPKVGAVFDDTLKVEGQPDSDRRGVVFSAGASGPADRSCRSNSRSESGCRQSLSAPQRFFFDRTEPFASTAGLLISEPEIV